MTSWLVLIVRLPPHPSSLRVRAWRKLKALGAVALKNSVYLLPSTPEHYEQCQWLSQEAQRSGGEATLLQVERIENLPSDEVVRLFRTARDQDYRRLGERYRRLLRVLDRRGPGRSPARQEEELARLAKELDRLRQIDFFDAPGSQEVERLREAVEGRLRLAAPSTATGREGAPLAAFRGRRWVTRPRPHVDRVASAWLIKRFLDPEAEFLFATPEEFPEDAIPFDAVGAEFGHQGDDCTFETLLTRGGLRDRRLSHLAEIVHEADLRDDKFHRQEARGIDLVIRGLLLALKDDHEALAHGLTLFDGLYEALGDRKPAPRRQRGD